VTLAVNPGYVARPRKRPTEQRATIEEKQSVKPSEDGDVERGLGGAAVQPLRLAEQPAEQERPIAISSTAEDSGHSMIDILHEGPTNRRQHSQESLIDALNSGPPAPPPTTGTVTTESSPTVPTAPAVHQTPKSHTPLHSQPPKQLQNNGNQPQPPATWGPARPPSGYLPTNLNEFLDKEIFVCESDGLPRYCIHCNCWKPDRSHHCSEVGRCVWRMDHFCPWVGGVVAETSYRYFYQVVVYGSLYCLFLIITLGILINECNQDHEGLDGRWISVLALYAASTCLLFGSLLTFPSACVFGFFSSGMAFSTTQLIYRNISTIDALGARTKVYQLAIHDPDPPTPDVPFKLNVLRVWLPPNPRPGEQQKCFAIVKTLPGENPWKQGSIYKNFKESLGGRFWSWFALWGVLRPGSSGEEAGFYKWNDAVIKKLKREAGIPQKDTQEREKPPH
jgi:palmitoyltransferase